MIAIYVRQSVDKKDSISIETQIETCRAKLISSEVGQIEIFSDKGFSGKSTARPEFMRMMSQVRSGKISKIIVYKMDRISRSLIDFLNMREEFIRYNVVFISCGEDFDTSTPMGKLMINIIMMFAELERETIQKRIKDNYYARGEKGLYLGGYAPFGFKKVETQLNEVKTYMYEKNIEEGFMVQLIFKKYSEGDSLDSIARWLNESGVLTRQKKQWSSTTLARLLRNPVYVKADKEIYNYLKGLGATMNNSVDEYTGESGCLVYGNAQNRKQSKFIDLNGEFVTLGLHKGIVGSELWLLVQHTLLERRTHRKSGAGYTTWLQGMAHCKCGCKYHLKKHKTKNKEYKYLYCPGKKKNLCPHSGLMLPVETLEQIIECELIHNLIKLIKGLEQFKTIKEDSDINKDDIFNAILFHAKEIEKIYAMVHPEYTIDVSKDLSLDTFLAIQDICHKWHSFDTYEKRRVMIQIIKRIIIIDKHIIIEYK